MTIEQKYKQEQISNIQKIMTILGIPMSIENVNKIPDIIKRFSIEEKKCYCEVYLHGAIVKELEKVEFDANGDCRKCGLRNHKLDSF